MGYAHFQVHTDKSLAAMEESWCLMHEYLPGFKELGPERDHFNIPKLHNIRHYPASVCRLGTTDGYNTKNTECLHIDLAKNGYRASNRRDYTQQMACWLTRQEAVHQHSLYLEWACPGYTAGQGYVPPDGIDRDDPEDSDGLEEEEEADKDSPEIRGDKEVRYGFIQLTPVEKFVKAYNCSFFERV
ncbi:hypothetical protein HMN09_00483400 [Mycena chlorophos]|uniref:Uncharacterized protein n=1 Tax=Mycena chlorophos TaxID=658473 RepID=A0A8H6WH51_MYCCL|nr:hypothetical protein HMN09_00483400 [Mycena chlorophos]